MSCFVSIDTLVTKINENGAGLPPPAAISVYSDQISVRNANILIFDCVDRQIRDFMHQLGIVNRLPTRTELIKKARGD
jgi:hypothetical protein